MVTDELFVVWPPERREMRGDDVRLDAATALSDRDLRELLPDRAAAACVRSHGKGASGLGVGFVIETAERVLNDTASLIAIGVVLRQAIRRVSERRSHEPVGVGTEAVAALAAAETPGVADEPDQWFHARTTPLTTDGGSGVDSRDVWGSTFVNQHLGLAQVVFTSTTTRHLGSVVVAMERWSDGTADRTRSDEELAAALTATFVR